jgi:hypothetical protein
LLLSFSAFLPELPDNQLTISFQNSKKKRARSLETLKIQGFNPNLTPDLLNR